MRKNTRSFWFISLAILAVACSGSTPEQPSAVQSGEAGSDSTVADPNPGSVDRPAQALPLPGEQPPSLPSGHPPTGEAEQRRLQWDVPDDWVAVPPASSMRLAQYRIPGPAGDGSLAVFYFGPGMGGDPMSNAVRWAQQFEQPDGSSSVDQMQVTELESKTPVRLVEVTGIYDGGMTMTSAPPQKQSGWMLLGAIAEGPDAPWFFKLTGPEETVRANRSAMIGMMESLRVSG